MAARAKSDRVEEPKKVSNRRERDFMRYAEAVFGLSGWQDSGHSAKSGDRTLTAFAQLIALRLNAKRSLISLYDKGRQYMLAEATRTLSLQDDSVHEPGDALIFGATNAPHRKGMNSQAMYPAEQPPEYCIDGVAVVFPDLHLHERFSQHELVLAEPFFRSYAGVALLGPSGSPVGTLSIIDDKPRPQGLSSLEVSYMQSVATSVMSHLELMRTKAIYERGLKMIKGLSRFMDGETLIEDAHALQNSSTGTRRPSNQELSGAGALANNSSIPENSTVDRKDQLPRKQDPRPTFTLRPLAPSRKPSSGSTTGSSQNEQNAHPQITAANNKTSEDTLKVFGDPQEGLVSPEVTQLFKRAAITIQDAMDMAGVLFLGASAGGLGSLRNSAGLLSGTEDGESTTAGSDSALPAVKPTEPDRKLCACLAAALRPLSEDLSGFVLQGISEAFLKSLMKRFPFGRIWNFSDDELLSSDEYGSDGSGSAGRVQRNDNTLTRVASIPSKRKRMRSDHERILEMFPGVRSFGIMPMWDSQRQRFFAGAIVWSYNTSRMFSMTDEINYLGAFCDVIMNEISRMDQAADAQQKTTFISSITHELRSPLHGILGAVECLQESLDPSTQDQMVSMIDTCGRSLLDIISNLIDRAQARPENGAVRMEGAKRRKRRGHRPIPPSTTGDLAILTEEVIDSALWLTPEPAPQSTVSKAENNIVKSDEPLKVILDVDSSNLTSSDWTFHVNPGAWRRIVQNLVSNSIKYSDRGGYCRVILGVSKPSIDQERPTSVVYLTCADSGRGMSKEYLEHGLWQEFQQEESNVQGTGLGLSLVRNLVEEMGGSIDVSSQKWVGTTIRVSVPLVHAPPSGSQHVNDAGRLIGLSFNVVGFDGNFAGDDRAADAYAKVRDSILKSGKILGMYHAVSDATSVDVSIMTEREAAAAMQIEQTCTSSHGIILCDSVSSSRAFAANHPDWMGRAILAAQPLGPQKLRKALLSCLEQPSMHTVVNNHSPGPPIQSHIRVPSLSNSPATTSSLEQQRKQVISPPAVLPTDVTSSAPPSILLVDDNPVNLSLLQRSINKIGHSHISATNGLEAVEAYQKSLSPVKPAPKPPDSTENETHHKPIASAAVSIIFMDITMPVMDGLESTRRIRAYERAMKLRPSKIAALTALASPQARQEAYSCGIDLFLTKPVRFKEIQEILSMWI